MSTTRSGSVSGMSPDYRRALEDIITFANSKWVEAHTAEAATSPPSPEQTARKAAYDDIMQHARSLLDSRLARDIRPL